MKWLKQSDCDTNGKPSWRSIVQAVGKKSGGDNMFLAVKISQNHLLDSQRK